jgi:FlaA1/EpsC-like NDP-sugar epimerase
MKIDYESVIRRSEIPLDLSLYVGGNTDFQKVLITGAGGSIGSRITLALSKFTEIELLATDRDENRLHSLSLEMMGSALFKSSTFRVLDIRDKVGVSNIVADFRPSMIIHAAALKHLAILEAQPREAYLTNFIGTRNLLEAARVNQVSKFLNISTDKAANPTSILGKTKFMAEVLTALERRDGLTGFTNVRFGNVFNSMGSVIETFTRQIELGLPITLTHKDVSRYFMKIEEAANLSLCSVVLNQGEVHILDMGDPVKLIDVIHRMLEILGGNSNIVTVGLRECEKISEELWSRHEEIIVTSQRGISAANLAISGVRQKEIDSEPRNDHEAILAINEFLKYAKTGI